MTEYIDRHLEHEAEHVRQTIEAAVKRIEREGGSIRAYSALLLTAAVRLHAEVEGTDGLARAITGLGQRALIEAGRAGSA